MAKKTGDSGHWIQGAIKRPGALHRATNTPMGEKIPMAKIKKAEHSSNKRVAAEARLGERLKSMNKR